MDDNNLKQIFESYNPAISSDKSFMRRLESNILVIEKMKSQIRHERRKNRVALCATLFIGFIMGYLSFLFFQTIILTISELATTFKMETIYIQSNSILIGWFFITLVTTTMMYMVYSLFRE